MTPWTPERIEQVKTLAHAGLSASLIAADLGDVSRNAVVGIGHRHGIKFHGGDGGTNRKAKPKTQCRINLPTETAPEYVGMITIMELSDTTCRFPVGDPLHPDFRYCGKWKSDDATLPYCGLHSRLAYETSKQRRDHASKQAG